MNHIEAHDMMYLATAEAGGMALALSKSTLGSRMCVKEELMKKSGNLGNRQEEGIMHNHSTIIAFKRDYNIQRLIQEELRAENYI